MSASRRPRVAVTLARQTVPLTQHELDSLLRALADMHVSAATSIGEEIAALRLAGVRIQLLPNEHELAALRSALRAAEHTPRSGSGLGRLRALCA